MRVVLLGLVFSFSTHVMLGQNSPALNVGGNSVHCSDGMNAERCGFSQQMLKVSLEQLKPATAGWQIVVVPAERWQRLCKTMNVKPCAPAFSMVDAQRTYLISSLTVLDSKVDEYLQKYTTLRGMERLKWVVAHELGHILCHNLKEEEAREVAARARFSENANWCPAKPSGRDKPSPAS